MPAGEWHAWREYVPCMPTATTWVRAERVDPELVRAQQLTEESYTGNRNDLWSRQRWRLINDNMTRAYHLRQRVADRRAMDLLRRYLSEDQRRELDANGYFIVSSADDKRQYRVDTCDHIGNVKLLAYEEPIPGLGRHGYEERPFIEVGAWYCCHINTECPTADNALSQKLWLENPELERRWFEMANMYKRSE